MKALLIAGALLAPLTLPQTPAELEKNAAEVIDCHDGQDPDVNNSNGGGGVGAAKGFFTAAVKAGIHDYNSEVGGAVDVTTPEQQAEVMVTVAKIRLVFNGPCDPNNHNEWGMNTAAETHDNYYDQCKIGANTVCAAYELAKAITGEDPETSAAAQQEMLRNLALMIYGGGEGRQEQRAHFFTEMLSIDRSVRLGVHPVHPCD
jgi:hypothetical protein